MDKISLNTALQHSRIATLKMSAIAVFYVLFQIVIILQRPFIQINFIQSFYISMLGLFVVYFANYKLAGKYSLLVSLFEVGSFVFLFKSQPQYSSFYLIMILIVLFLSCLELSERKGLLLIVLSSLAISILNLTHFKWVGLQNWLNLGLFNISFFSVFMFSSQLRFELMNLSRELTQTTTKLRSKEEFSGVLLEHVPLGLVAADEQLKLLFANEYFNRQLDLDQAMLSKLVQQSEGKAHVELQFYHSKYQDKRFYQFDKTQYFDADFNKDVSLFLIRDITDLRILQDQIRQKEKLAAVGQLAAGIAHEIRNPLAGISGSIELLSQDTTNPDDQKLMKIILKEIDRLNNLITDFLDYSKPEKRPDQKMDIAFILDEVLQNIKMSAHAPSQLSIQTEIQPASILGFSDKLKQAFLNIMMNAVQAMKDVSNPSLIIKTIQDDQFVTVTIADTGCGMTPEVQQRIFEPFFTTKSKGTGLGMAMTHKIFEAHEASVLIDSEPNKGTTFKIKFKKV